MLVFTRPPAKWLASIALAWLSLTACSPTFNWREMRTDGAPLLALMPCKPESATRPVPLLGQPTELHMHSCEAGGLTFAVAWAELTDDRQIAEALDQWQAASLTAIRVAPGAAASWESKVPGATVVRGVAAQGSDHMGQALQTRAVYFAQGRKIFQAAIYGPQMASEASGAFFDGLSLQ